MTVAFAGPGPVGIAHLPVEILSRIFLLGAFYDYPYSDSPFLLKPDTDYYQTPSSQFQCAVSRVCARWREIAVATPSLWTFIFLRMPCHIDRAKIFMKRALRVTTTTIDILIDAVDQRQHVQGLTIGPPEIEIVLSTVCKHAARWRSFHLKVRDRHCKLAARKFLSTCGPAPFLETLQLYHFEDYTSPSQLHEATYKPPVTVFDNSIPNLRNVGLIGVNLPWENAPYLRSGRLTNLELALHPNNIRPTHDFWNGILRASSSSLVRLSLRYSGPKVDGAWSDAQHPIVLDALRELCLSDLEPEYSCMIMERLQCPHLMSLRLNLPEQDFAPLLALLLDSRIPLDRLQHLRINALECSDENHIRELLQRAVSVREVEIDFEQCPRILLDLVHDGFKRRGDRQLFSSLQVFTVAGVDVEEIRRLIEARETRCSSQPDGKVLVPPLRWVVRGAHTDATMQDLFEHGCIVPGRPSAIAVEEYKEMDEEEEGEEDEEIDEEDVDDDQ